MAFKAVSNLCLIQLQVTVFVFSGKEFSCGVYVTSVLPSSKAAQAGLKVGDEIVRINGLILSEATHEEVTNLIKLKKSLILTVRG